MDPADALPEIPELVRVACPCTYVDENTPPVLLVHGGADQIVPVEQSVRFYEAIVQRCGGGRVKLHIAEGMLHHGDPWYLEPWVMDMCLDYLDGILKG